MKKQLLSNLLLLIALLLAGAGTTWAGEYSHEFKSGELKSGDNTIDKVKWNLSMSAGSIGWDSNNGKGIQFGTSKTPAESVTLKTSDINGIISSIKITASIASSGDGKLSTSIGGKDIGSQVTLTTTSTEYTFENANDTYSGEIVISFTNTAKAMYLKKIVVTYTEAAATDPTIIFNDGTTNVGKTIDLSKLFTSNSTGEVEYSIVSGSENASLKGSILTATAAGTVSVKASQTATSSYNAAEATATIIINAALTLSNIAITTPPTKTVYSEGETFDATGMVVTATYSDNSTDDVTASCTFAPSTVLATSDTEITISYTENGTTKTATQAIKVKEVLNYATLPFTYNNGKSGLPTGLTQSGLGDDYGSAPKLKFDSTGDYLILKINEAPGNLSFDIKGNSFSDGTFTVQASADGQNYNDIVTYTTISGNTESKTINSLGDNVRYIKWIYTTKSSGNVALGNISLAKPTAEPAIVPISTTITTSAEAQNGEMEIQYKNLTDIVADVVFYEADGETTATYSWLTAKIDDNSNNLVYEVEENNTTAARTAYLKVYALDEESEYVYSELISITQNKPVVSIAYTLATEVVPGRHYVIAGGTEGDVAVLGSQNGDYRNQVKVTASNGTLNIDEEAGVTELLIEYDAENNLFTIKDGDSYLYANSSSKNNVNVTSSLTDNARWSISFDEKSSAIVKAQGTNSRNWLRYNSQNTRFSCYDSSSTMQDIYLFERAGDTGSQALTVSIAEACTDGSRYYGTFSAPFAVTVPEDVTVAEIGVANDKLQVSSYEAGAVIPANTGVMVSSATAGEKTFTSAKGGTSVKGTDNCLRPSGVTAAEMAERDANCLYYRLTMHNGKQIGYWWGAEEGAAFSYSDKRKAYLAVPQSLARQGFAFDNEDTTAISDRLADDNGHTIFNLNGQRVGTPRHGLYIINGKKTAVR